MYTGQELRRVHLNGYFMAILCTLNVPINMLISF